MKPLYFFLLIFLGFVEGGPDTNGCIVGSNKQQQNKNKFSGLSEYRNTIGLVFCSNFDSENCDDPPYDADDDGFYRTNHFPCKYFTGDANNEGKPVISFFSRVVVDGVSGNMVRFYPQATDKSGLFLTKTFKTKVSSEGATKDTLSDKVAAVTPRYSGQEEEFTPPEISCFHTELDGNQNDVSSTEISTSLDGETGKVHCTYSAQCDNLKRSCDGNLIVRTSTAELVDTDDKAEDGVEVDINNGYYFLKIGESTEINCGNNDGDVLSFEWFKNGDPIEDQDGKTYSYNHQDKDTMLQCQIWETTIEEETEVQSTRVTATYIWNVFTVGPAGPVEPEASEEDIKVTHKQNTDFDCNSEVDSFPSPWGLWYWLSDEQDAVEQFEKVTGRNNQFSFTKNISYSNFGNFKLYLFNGIGEKVLAKDYKTVFVVDTEVKQLVPIPKFWYEYNVLTSPPEVYYVSGDTVNISCDVTKEAEYDIWWQFGEEYFHLFNDNGNNVLKRLDTSNTLANVADTMVTEERERWSITKFDDEESLGLQTRQDFVIAEYTSSNDEEEAISVKCFLVNPTSTSTVAQLISSTTDADERKLKELSVRIFTHTARPVVKGPLNQIQSEKEAKDMVLNCKTNGVPPVFIYFMFTDNKTDGINVTREVLREPKINQFTRYNIERKSDNLTCLTITKPTEKDEGKFTCYAINRDTTEESPVAGPDADVFIEERCSEGAQFCFKNFVCPLTSSFKTSVFLLLISLSFS